MLVNAARLNSHLHRLRLEGRVERLERSVFLLESIVDALNRETLSDDDLRTLREGVTQLAQLDEALTAARRHEAAAALAELVTTRLRWLDDALTLKLGQEPGSPRVGLEAVLWKLAAVPRPPAAHHPRLMTSAPASMVAPVTTALLTSAVAVALTGEPTAFAVGLFPLAAWAVGRPLLARRRSWELLADRLHLPADGRKPTRVLRIGDLTEFTATQSSVMVRGPWGREVLVSDDPARLTLWLDLLRSPWLANLEATPLPSVRCSARDEASRQDGVAVVMKEGVLFLPAARRVDVARALAPRASNADLNQLLALLVHVPEGRWKALGRALADACSGVWLLRKDARVDVGHVGHLTLEGNAPTAIRVRLFFELNPNERALRAQAEQLLHAP